MKLLFTVRRQYGNTRYYAANDASEAIVTCTGRKCMDLKQLNTLHLADFEITLRDAETNVEKSFVGLNGLASSLKKGEL